MNWDDLIDDHALAKLLPDEYRHYAGPVKEALAVFLAGLSPDRQASVLAEQMALPASAAVSVRLGTLARSCPVLQKLGQTLAREPKLDQELRCELQQLESLPPTVESSTIERTLHEELGRVESRGIRLDPPALAEASVAVVVPFLQCDAPDDKAVRRGVFKLLKPGVEARLEEELQLMDQVGAHLDEHCEALGIPHLDYRESFHQVQQKLMSELDFEHEQQLLTEARGFYRDEPGVLIPELLDHCSPRVTAMERVDGCKITDCPYENSAERAHLASTLTRALISRPILASRGKTLFHGDPHAGNLLRASDGRLAILDWSLAGRLPEMERVAINKIMLAAITLRGEKLFTHLSELAKWKNVDRPALRHVVATGLKKIRRGQFPGLSWLIGLLDDATQNALRVAGELMLFRKSLLTLDGVLHELGASSVHNDKVLLVDFMRQFTTEWPQRWVTEPTSRAFGTRLSNLDLTDAMLNFPWTPVRYWLDESADAVRLFAKTARKQLQT